MRALVVIAVLLLAPVAQAQVRLEPDRIELGEHAAVRRVYTWCADSVAATCAWWQPEGELSFGGLPDLEQAATFAHTASGRIVAMVSAFGRTAPLVLGIPQTVGALLLYTDDLGQTWRLARWPDSQLHAIAIAFDPAGPTGIAVGPDGSVWSSDDDGLSWRRRRSSTGAGFSRVWVRGRTCVIEDTTGALWISRDRGFSLDALAERGAVDDRGPELVVTAGSRTHRIDARGVVRRD